MKRTERDNDLDESPDKRKDPNQSRTDYPELVFEDPYEDSFESESMEEGSEHELSEDGVTAMQESDEEEGNTEVGSCYTW